MPTEAPRFRSPLRLAKYAAQHESHFFSPGAMSFFDSRVHDGYLRRTGDGTYLIVVSNQFHPDEGDAHPREYAVVEVNTNTHPVRADYATEDRFETAQQARIMADHIAA